MYNKRRTLLSRIKTTDGIKYFCMYYSQIDAIYWFNYRVSSDWVYQHSIKLFLFILTAFDMSMELFFAINSIQYTNSMFDHSVNQKPIKLVIKVLSE